MRQASAAFEARLARPPTCVADSAAQLPFRGGWLQTANLLGPTVVARDWQDDFRWQRWHSRVRAVVLDRQRRQALGNAESAALAQHLQLAGWTGRRLAPRRYSCGRWRKMKRKPFSAALSASSLYLRGRCLPGQPVAWL